MRNERVGLVKLGCVTTVRFSTCDSLQHNVPVDLSDDTLSF